MERVLEASHFDTPVERLDELLADGDPLVLDAIASNPAASDEQLAALVGSRPGRVMNNPRVLLHALAGEVPEWLGARAKVLFLLQPDVPLELREVVRDRGTAVERLALRAVSEDEERIGGRAKPDVVATFVDAVADWLPLPNNICERLGPEYALLGVEGDEALLERRLTELEQRDWVGRSSDLVVPIVAAGVIGTRREVSEVVLERLVRALVRGVIELAGRHPPEAHGILRERACVVLEHPGLRVRRLHFLRAKDDPCAASGWRRWIAEQVYGQHNPLMATLAQSTDALDRQIAATGSSDPELLAALSSDHHPLVRYFVAENGATPAATLAQLCSDALFWVADAASKRIPEADLELALRSAWFRVRVNVATRTVSRDLLDRLLADPHADVRGAASKRVKDLGAIS